MDAFVSRKRRRPTSPPPIANQQTTQEISALSAEDDESTDFKLALLSSSHPDLDQLALLDILLANDGNVEKASASLMVDQSPVKKSSANLGYQSSLAGFLGEGENTGKRPKLLSKKGKTLHLYSPEDIAAHTPCSIIHNFLPSAEANALLRELLKEAPTYERTSFKLFDNIVQSPHTACFYVESYEETQTQKTE